jgi:two-component system, LuxR family, sensor kinase FixL
MRQLSAIGPAGPGHKSTPAAAPARFAHPLRGRGAELYIYLAIYLGLEWASQFHSFEFLDIALWNPSPAASLILLLTRGIAYAPLLFMAGLLSSVFVHHNPHSFPGTIASAALVATGYTALAATLRRAGFRLGRGATQDVAALLILAPAGALLSAALACGALVLTGDIPRDQLVTALTQFWVGDTLGIVIVMATATALLVVKRWGVERSTIVIALDSAVFFAGIGVALWCMFGLKTTDDHQFFYLMFLPVIWVAIRDGFAGAALAVLLAQLALLAVTEAVGYAAGTFIGLQMLMLALAATGLLLGAAVSERRLSEARAKTHQAELARMARNATAGAMGVALAHQISQPLSSVATHIHVALRQAMARANGQDDIVHSLSVAKAEMHRAQDVLGRLREFISHGKSEAAAVDFSALVIGLADVLRAEAGRKGVRLSLDLAAVTAVTADALQIEQVLLNLVTNAVEAAAEHNQRSGRVLVRTATEAGAVRLIVEDNGSGIAAEIAERLYQPFVSSKASGMGLGLALSRQIVTHHGGRLWWEPLHSGGTRFIVACPIDREGAP